MATKPPFVCARFSFNAPRPDTGMMNFDQLPRPVYVPGSRDAAGINPGQKRTRRRRAIPFNAVDHRQPLAACIVQTMWTRIVTEMLMFTEYRCQDNHLIDKLI